MRTDQVAHIFCGVLTPQVRRLVSVLRVPGRSLGPVLGLIATLVPLPFLSGLLPIVHFLRERIDVAVYPEEVRVEGLYVYRNPWPLPVVQGLSIPLPVDATHPMPIQIAATRLSPGEGPIPTRNILGQYRFELVFAAREEVAIKVQYRQYTPGRNAYYLLTTTRPWRRPLLHGVYRLLPVGVTVLASNYALQQNSQGMLIFQRDHFMPREDWQFSWEVQSK